MWRLVKKHTDKPFGQKPLPERLVLIHALPSSVIALLGSFGGQAAELFLDKGAGPGNIGCVGAAFGNSADKLPWTIGIVAFALKAALYAAAITFCKRRKVCGVFFHSGSAGKKEENLSSGQLLPVLLQKGKQGGMRFPHINA